MVLKRQLQFKGGALREPIERKHRSRKEHFLWKVGFSFVLFKHNKVGMYTFLCDSEINSPAARKTIFLEMSCDFKLVFSFVALMVLVVYHHHLIWCA